MSRIHFFSKSFPIIQIWIIVFFLISIFSILWIRSNVIAVEYRLSTLEEKKKEMLKEQKLLLAEKASLTSIARIDNNNTVMVFPDRNKVIYISGRPDFLVKTVSFKKTN